MESNRDSDGKLTPLARQNIDTGLGLERMAQILQQVPNNYETDLILPIVTKAAQLAGLQYDTASAADKTDLKVSMIGPGCHQKVTLSWIWWSCKLLLSASKFVTLLCFCLLPFLTPLLTECLGESCR